MPKPKERCSRGRGRSAIRAFGFSIASSSRLPEMYQITTLSPFLMGLPPISASSSAVRRIWITGVCQRMISDTRPGISAGLSRTLRRSSGYWLSPQTPPDIELRVVSFPPTRKRIRMPMRSRNDILLVRSLCARIEMMSNSGGRLARSSHNTFMYSVNLSSSAKRSSSERTSASGALMSQIATSDHRISSRRSSSG